MARAIALAQVPPAAELAGLHPRRWDAGFLCLLALVCVLGTSTLGTVMVIAMLFLPAEAVLPWAKRVPGASSPPRPGRPPSRRPRCSPPASRARRCGAAGLGVDGGAEVQLDLAHVQAVVGVVVPVGRSSCR
jgi:hypothetical protein